MTPTQTAALLRAFHDAWPSFEVTEGVRRLWATTCQDIDLEIGKAAFEVIKREDDWAPSPARFLKVCGNEDRGGAIEAPRTATEDCAHCDHGFVPGKPVEQKYAQRDGTTKVVFVDTVKPCEHCRPAQFKAWAEQAVKANARRSRVPDGERTFEANPQEGLAMLRDTLAGAKPWTPVVSDG